MNLLYFTQLFYPAIFGGGEYLFYLLTRSLSKRGHKTYVITQKLMGTSRREEFEGIEIIRIGSDFQFSGTLPPTISHNLAYLVGSVIGARRIIHTLKKEGKAIDLIHSNTYVPALAGQICGRLYNIPHIVTFHDVYQAQDTRFWNEWMRRSKTGTPFYASVAARWIEKIVLKMKPDMFHTVSEVSKCDLSRFGVSENKIQVIPNGIDKMDFVGEESLPNSTHQNDPQAETAIFVGRLVFYKNVETILRAFKLVVKEFPNAKLLIIGDGPSKNQLVDESFSIRESVVFTGRISQKEKVQLIKDSTLMVFPSLMEGFGIAIIEGFACTKPVLVSDVRPLSDIVTNGYDGYILPPFDEKVWAEKIIELFKDKTKCQELGKNAHAEFLQKYELEKVVSKIEDLYSVCLKTKMGLTTL